SAQMNTASTSLANFSAASSPPSPCSAREYIGTKATENAPSANSRRNVLGRMKATCQASAAAPAPSARASSMSRAKPNTRLMAVSPPIVPTFLTRLTGATPPEPELGVARGRLVPGRFLRLPLLQLLHIEAVEIDRV